MYAQTPRVHVTGYVRDKESKESIIQATVRFCTVRDTTMVTGTVTDKDGKFDFPTLNAGKYLLVLSYMGYQTQYSTVTVSAKEKSQDLGTYTLLQSAIALKEAVVTGSAAKVTAKDDSIIFNSAAFKVREGAMLEELVKKLPGIKVDKNGGVTVNGESVSKILIDGHEFFSNDMSMAMKNIPADMVEKLKTYKKKSDMTRITGIDDGTEETVLDLTVKKDMTRGFFNNIDIAGGTDESYSVNASSSRFKKDNQYTLMGSLGNVDGPWSEQNGTSKRQNVGFNFFKKTEKLELGGDASYDGNRQLMGTRGSSETFLTTSNIYSNSFDRNRSKQLSYDASLRLEWKPDSMTNIMFRPGIRHSDNRSESNNQSATFNKNPFDYSADPLSDVEDDTLFPDSSRVNNGNSRSKNVGNTNSGNASLQIFRRLSKKGRSITLRAEGSYSKTESDQYNNSYTNYYLVKKAAGGDSTLYTNQYLTTPAKNSEWSLHLNYVEPIFKKVYLQFSYEYTNRYNNSDRSTYDLTPYILYRRDSMPPLGYLPDYYGERIHNLSKYAEYDNDIHEGEISLRFDRTKWNLSTGVKMTNTHTKMTYDQGVLDTTVSRTVNDFSPTLFFNYKFNKMSHLRVRYRGNSSQPSMTDMLPVRDETNPMWITEGNPNLRSSFSNSLRASIDTYDPARQRGINAGLDFQNSYNNVSTKINYDESTGKVESRPENINGNWSADANFGYNTAFTDQRFSIDSYTSGSYRNQVAYISVGQSTSQKGTTKTMGLSQSLRGNFRNDWIDFTLKGDIDFNRSRSDLRSSNDMDTYDFSYGAELQLQLPLDFSISSDIEMSSRRGYDDDTFNTNELIWNGEMGWKFLKDKQASLSLEMFDLLHKRSNVSRFVSATTRSDTRNLGVLTNYWMLHFIYRFNIFGV